MVSLPSINVPVTNNQGLMHPIWYEFFRAFIAGLDLTGTTVAADNTVISGDGIEGTGSVETVTVGAGEGIVVNANDVAVDILHQENVQAELEDEILISDASDGSRIKKTSLRDVSVLSVANPGGSNTYMQYNKNGTFGGDTGFTTDGAGTLAVTGQLTVDNIILNANTISTDSNSNPMWFYVPSGGLNQYLFTQSGTAASATSLEVRGLKSETGILIRSDSSSASSLADATLSFATNNSAVEWTLGLYDSSDDDFVLANSNTLGTNTIFTINRTGRAFKHSTNTMFKTVASITASTTQTQGQGALTGDINEVSTCANANDTVTLPTAVTGAQCLVINNGANTLQVFPASGDNLGAGLNTSTTIASGSRKLFVAYDTTNWEPVI